MNNFNCKQKILSTFLLILIIGTTSFISVGTPFFMLGYPKIFAAKIKIQTKG
jgi:hypothetical protein